jgi:hypothetical protein
LAWNSLKFKGIEALSARKWYETVSGRFVADQSTSLEQHHWATFIRAAAPIGTTAP